VADLLKSNKGDSNASRPLVVYVTPTPTPTVVSTPTPRATPTPTVVPVLPATPAPAPRIEPPLQSANVSGITPPPPRYPHTAAILINTFEVKPGHYNTTSFTVSGRGARISGRFRALSGDNIKAYILGPDAYVNFKHNNDFSSYYRSGKTAVGNIDISLAPGLYYLVFENTYSLFSKKVVQAEVMMEH
jgi:hypothetical protein